MTAEPRIEAGWKHALAAEFAHPYMFELRTFLESEREAGYICYPPASLIFNAFNLTPFDAVRVVIVGQDPYHGPGQAHGLSFSVPDGVKIPPSLANIFREIDADLGIGVPASGNLRAWARQGVLMLNATLTVRAHTSGSHQGRGWERFTAAALRAVHDQHEGVVFMLWGRFAQRAGDFIDRTRHTVLEAAHPSPLSARTGFLGCKHFSQANEALKMQGKNPIDWAISAGAVQADPVVG